MHQRGGDTGGGLVAEPNVLPPGRRVLALVALLCLGGALAVLIWGGMRSAPELLLAIGVLGVGAGGAGYAVVRAGHRRRFGIGLAVFAVVACVVLAIDADLPSIRATGRLIAFAVLVAGYVVSSRAALRRTHRVSDLVRRQHRPRRPVLLLNPGSGQESSTVRVREAARRIGVPVVELGVDGEDLTAMATTAIEGGADCLAVAGGDGSISAVAAVAVEHDVPVLVVPAGTRNHFALDLGLDVRRPERAVRAVRRGSLSRVDLGSVNGRTFVNNVGLGAYAHVVHHEHYRLARWGTALEALPEVMSPEGERANFSFVDHEGTRHDGADVLLVSNNPYELR
ncbi:MAG: diacylglycerol kinase family protein, partial [Ilumatobacteraceae bacterium]